MELKALTPEIDKELGIVRYTHSVERTKSLELKNTLTTGRIGREGDKVHAFQTSYIEVGGVNYLYGFYAGCGSQSYKSGSGSTFSTDLSRVNCKKCLKMINKTK